MTSDQRPLSPHIQIYKPQITSVLSITHRGTGILLAIGFAFLVYWMLAIAGGPDAFAAASEFFRSVPGRLIMLGVGFSFFFHLCNGIRHLFWDMGKGFEIETTRASGWAVVVVSSVLTVLAWLVAYGTFGGGA